MNNPHTLVQAESGYAVIPYPQAQGKCVNEQQSILQNKHDKTHQPDTLPPHQSDQVEHPPQIKSWPCHQLEQNQVKKTSSTL